MKFEHYLKRVEDSKEFKKFRSQHKKSKLCAGFFVLDYESGKNMHQVDYALPNGKIATFILDDGIQVKISEQALKKELPEIKKNLQLDIDALKGIVEDEMKNRVVTEKIKKIIAVLHVLDNQPVWNLQCILEGLIMLNVHLDDKGKILKFEKHSLMEMIKTIPGNKLPQSQEKQDKQNKVVKISPEELDKLQKELDKLKQVKK